MKAGYFFHFIDIAIYAYCQGGLKKHQLNKIFICYSENW